MSDMTKTAEYNLAIIFERPKMLNTDSVRRASILKLNLSFVSVSYFNGHLANP